MDFFYCFSAHMAHNRINYYVAQGNRYVYPEFLRNCGERGACNKAYSLLYAERFKIRGKNHIQFVVVRCTDCQIERRNSLFRKKTLVRCIAAAYGNFRETLGGGFCKLFVRINYYDFLRRFPGFFREHFYKRTFLRLNDFACNESSYSSCADNCNFLQVLLARTAQFKDFAQIVFGNKDSKTASGFHYGVSVRQSRISVNFNVCNKHRNRTERTHFHKLVTGKNASGAHRNA